MKKRIISIFLLIVIVIGVATTAVVSSLASDTEDELYDYAKFEVDYLMNRVEYNGDMLNGSANVYDMVINDDFFNHDIYNYLQDHSFYRGVTVAQVQLYDNGIDLIANPEHFYSIVLLDILQSKDLYDLNSDSLKSSVGSDTQQVFGLTLSKFGEALIKETGINSITDLKNAKIVDLPDNALGKLVDSVSEVTSKHVGFSDVLSITDLVSGFATTVSETVNRINTLYTIAGHNQKTIEALTRVGIRSSNTHLRSAILDIIEVYEAIDSPEEVNLMMSSAGYNIASFTVGNLLYYSTKFVLTTMYENVFGLPFFAWDLGTTIANLTFDVNDLNTGYLTVEAATIIEDELRDYLSACCSNYLSSNTAIDAEECRYAYKLVLTTQYYATNVVQSLGKSLASTGSVWGAIRSLFGYDGYQDVVDVCNSTRTRIEQRYYNWVALAQKMYKIIYGVSFNHAITPTNIPVTSVSFTKFSSYTLFSNEGICNRAVVAPSNATDSEVRYYSSDTSVAVVGAYGNIFAVGPGVATITARTSNGKSATCEITVLPYDATVVDGSYTIDRFTGGAIYADIPTGLNGYAVTRIGDSAFKGTKVTGATIPDCITYIGPSAFESCTELSSVIFSKSIFEIMDATFKNCSSLKDIIIPQNITSVGAEAYRNCDSFVNITIPDSIKFVGYAAFDDCDNLTSLDIGDGVITLNAFNFQSMPKLNSVTVGIGVIEIGSEKFMDCTLLQEVKINGAVASIGDRAFKNCTNLINMKIPETVKSIGTEAFSECNSLMNVVIPKGITVINDSTFYNCDSIDVIDIPHGVTEVGSYAFGSCFNLRKVFIPDTVVSIGTRAFSNCQKLSNIQIPKSTIEISDYSFYSCGNLTDIIFDGYTEHIGYRAFYGTGYYNDPDNWEDGVLYIEEHLIETESSLYECYIKEGTITIADRACKPNRVDVLKIPDSVLFVGRDAFSVLESEEVYYSGTLAGWCNIVFYDEGSNPLFNNDTCFYINEVDISDVSYDSALVFDETVTKIGDYAFAGFDGIYTVKISDSVTDIGKGAFFNCINLNEIEIGDGVVEIGAHAFAFCEALEVVTMGDGVKKIGESAFSNCDWLYSVKLGRNVTNIEKSAFSTCDSLCSMYLPESLTSIGEGFLWNIDGYAEIFYEGTAEQWQLITGTDVDGIELSVHYEHLHNFGEWKFLEEPTEKEYGELRRSCESCMCEDFIIIPALGFKKQDCVYLDFINNTISGFNAGETSLKNYTTTVNGYTWEYETSNGRLGTGSKAILNNGEAVVAQYTILVYGDINCDSWYDGQDAVLVSCLANGMLTKDDVSEAVYMAADCNHDGVIDQLDVDLLNQAGALLANVDQSKSADVLLETSSEYVEYLDLIDQSHEIEVEDNTETDVEPDVPESEEDDTHEEDTEDSTQQDNTEIDIFEMIITFFKSIFEMLLAHIPVPLK